MELANLTQPHTPGGTGGTSGICYSPPAIHTPYGTGGTLVELRILHQPYTPGGTGGTGASSGTY